MIGVYEGKAFLLWGYTAECDTARIGGTLVAALRTFSRPRRAPSPRVAVRLLASCVSVEKSLVGGREGRVPFGRERRRGSGEAPSLRLKFMPI